MSDSIVQVRNLGKQYRIGVKEEQPESLRAAVGAAIVSSFGYLRQMLRPPTEQETLWALRNVSFEVKQGEVLGVVGHNGAGKSTLLKILSRITAPTEGRAIINGRIGSLLEVGTGFHPELTGRENVYLNGAILGMRRREIDRRFDEIVAFSEIEKFIDTPVKRYSSGMYVRLAFAVASHLDTDILLMDEVLAVGDSDFQLKCVDKMHSLVEQGRTVLFVSHNMSAVSLLCERTLLLDKGQIIRNGATQQVLSEYMLTTHRVGACREWQDREQAPGNDVVRLRQVRVRTSDNETTNVVDIRRPVGIEMIYDVLQSDQILIPNLHFYNSERIQLFAVQDVGKEWRGNPRPVGRYVSTVWIPGNMLAEGTLLVTAAISSHIPVSVVHCRAPEVVAFQVVDSFDGDSARGDFNGPFPGVIRPLLQWETNVLLPQ